MIDQATDRLPTAAERELWAFNLGKRLIRDGLDDRRALTEQHADAVLDYVKGATREQEEQDRQEESVREV